MRYRTSDLDVEGFDVVWIFADGREVFGHAKFSPTGKMTAVVNLPKGERFELPEEKVPPLWRPKSLTDWPFKLPQPATVLSPPVRHVETASDKYYEVSPENDNWPYPGLRLGGAREKPRSARECDARILRCIRTAVVLEWEPTEPGEWAWPPKLRTEIRKMERVLRSSKTGRHGRLQETDYDDYHVDLTDSRPLPPRWLPTNRDVSDYEMRPNPMSFIPTSGGSWKKIFRWRAAAPPYSWLTISEILRQPPEQVMEAYNLAVERAWKAWQKS